MDDYREIITQLLLQDFSPVEIADSTYTPMSTALILLMFRGIVPVTGIDEHEIFSILEHNGFTKELQVIYEKDEDGNLTDEVKEYMYLWNLYKKA